jgi:hypothetical protein
MSLRSTQTFSKGNRDIGSKSFADYTLEFLTNSTNYPVGFCKDITLPYIELGRENCLINFSDDAYTVSRKHAAIIRTKNETIVKNLSKTNPTLVNGRPVIDQFFLKSGDEIQLSLEGPKLRFIEGKKLDDRIANGGTLNSLIKKAVLPYKKALFLISIFILLSIFTIVYMIYLN